MIIWTRLPWSAVIVIIIIIIIIIIIVIIIISFIYLFIYFLFSNYFLSGRKGRQVVSYNIKYWRKYRVYIKLSIHPRVGRSLAVRGG